MNSEISEAKRQSEIRKYAINVSVLCGKMKCTDLPVNNWSLYYI